MSKIRTLFVAIGALVVGTVAAGAGAQGSTAANGPDPLAFLAHVRNARLLAAGDLGAQLVDCRMPPENAAAAVGAVVDAPPTKIFDQLYYLGSNSVATWAIVTSAGIIQIDSLNNTADAQRVIIGGYKKLASIPAR